MLGVAPGRRDRGGDQDRRAGCDAGPGEAARFGGQLERVVPSSGVEVGPAEGGQGAAAGGPQLLIVKGVPGGPQEPDRVRGLVGEPGGGTCVVQGTLARTGLPGEALSIQCASSTSTSTPSDCLASSSTRAVPIRNKSGRARMGSRPSAARSSSGGAGRSSRTGRISCCSPAKGSEDSCSLRRRTAHVSRGRPRGPRGRPAERSCRFRPHPAPPERIRHPGQPGPAAG